MYNKKSRRAYGSGCISKNRAIGRYTVIWHDTEGVKHTCSKFPLNPVGKKQAEDFLLQQNAAASEGVKLSAQETLAKWIQLLLETGNNVRASTTQSRAYNAMRINRFAPELVDMPIADINALHIQRMYRKMLDGGLAASTIKRIHSLLCLTFRKAFTARVLRYNIMTEVTTPRHKRKEIPIFTWRQVGKVFRFLHKQKKASNRMSHDYVLFFRLLQGTGMRIGEALALRWEDINLQKREIHVHATASVVNGEFLESPKTASGDRYIPILSDRTYKMLAEGKENNKPSDWILHTSSGNRLSYSNLFHEWSLIKSGTGITQNIHNWRHTFATRMIAEGYPITEISRILGHSSQSITLDMYGHAIPSYNQQMILVYNDRRRKQPEDE